MGDGAGGHDADGELAEGPRADLQLMAGELGHEALGRLAVEAPVDEALELGRGDIAAPVAVAMPEGVDGVDLSEDAHADHLHDLDVAGVEESLLAAEEDESGLTVALVELEGLLHGVGQGLLEEDMLSGVEGVEGNLKVGVEGRGDDDGLDGGIVEQAPVVMIGFGRGHHLEGFVERGLIDVGEGDDVALGVLDEEAEEEAAAGAGADEA